MIEKVKSMICISWMYHGQERRTYKEKVRVTAGSDFGFRFGSVFQNSKISVSVRFGFSIFRSVFGSVFGFPIFQKLILMLSQKIWKENLQFSSLA